MKESGLGCSSLLEADFEGLVFGVWLDIRRSPFLTRMDSLRNKSSLQW
jgi:hypothetical protein